VIKALVASAPPAVVVKLHVAAALVLAATRCDATIENEVLVTWPPIAPESMPGEDTVVSPLVATVMPVGLPAVAAPMVKPANVMVTAVAAATSAAVVITIWGSVSAALAPVCSPLGAVKPIVSVGLVAKKPVG